MVEETTTVVGTDGIPVPLATVRLDAGPIVVARLDGELGPGRCVELIAVNGALIARAQG